MYSLVDPTRFIAYGGTGRIRVYGILDYDYAGVTLDWQGGLRCSLVKVAPLEAEAAPNQQPVAPRVWYEFQGRSIPEDIPIWT